MRPVSITGVGALSCLGTSPDALWKGLIAGESGIRRLPRLVRGGSRVTTGGEVLWPPAETPDRDVQLARAAIDQALAQAGVQAADAAFVWAAGLDTIDLVGSGVQHRQTGACFQALARDFARPRRMIAVACASGTQAIGEAYRLIRSGRAKRCLAGGSSAMLSVYFAVGFDALGAIAIDQPGEDAAQTCKPFDQRRRGFALGDGAGALVLEDREHALARGAAPLAEVAGFGTSQDAFDLNRPPEDGAGAELCLRRTLVDARLAALDVDVVNAHGTATLAGDLAEATATARVFGDRVVMHGIKGSIGHTMAAAGALEAIVSVQSLATGLIPPTRNLEQPDPRCALDLVYGGARQIDVRRVLSTSFGMGGQNAALILERSES